MPHTEKKVIARREHICSECNVLISKKDPYIRVSLAWFKNYYDSDETGFKTLKFCGKCSEPEKSDGNE